ncbi:glycerol kinase-like isoform X2 [Cimex lectularius]|uniref:glycerol kinase n=2 Tax=Cimex lectularius TaxID=79782 RepID=A0A8I6SJW9_CIMLE|nr:glycerol kinase-like isoform X2 [Cimex lectularius]
MCINQTVDNLKALEIDPADIVATGITNQRETTIAWDKYTGKPLYNAIVWCDMRTTETVDLVLKNVEGENKECLKNVCGLPVSTYFSATKIKWLLTNVEEVQNAYKEDRCYFGTMDSWLIWNLTGGIDGGVFVTDVTNASRTMLMNIKTLEWDPYCLSFFGIKRSCLAEIKSSSEIYSYFSCTVLQGTPLSGCLGDQQAALVGQMCLSQGQAKNTYGTGCFLLYNTGTNLVFSNHGLLSTVGYKMGPDAPTIYALEGSIAVAGAALRWLRDNLQLLQKVTDSKKIAEMASPVGEVVFVPAFSGLYAPYWRQDARSVICGITEETSKANIIRAALEAVCFQTRDILEAMNKDCGIPLKTLLVDGGMTNNDFLMQQLADIVGIPVIRPSMLETTALGAAMAAGAAKGIEVWNLKNLHSFIPVDTYLPEINDDERDYRYSRWKMAIQRSLNWSEVDQQKAHVLITRSNTFEPNHCDDDDYLQSAISKSIPGTIFIFTTWLILILAERLQ